MREFDKKYSSYKSRAKRKGLEFEFTKESFIKKTKLPCYICGKSPEGINGLDRLDNSEGYYEFNTASCCWNCNRAKSEMNRTEFEDWMYSIGAKFSEEYWKAMDKVEVCNEYKTKNYQEALIIRELKGYMKNGKPPKKRGLHKGNFRKWKS